ncbi:MAG: hypothetical protein TE42_07585 [Candidatus Synechococcus spongiarum SP3]|uniref:Tc1-like transposase DDE domain-containing protein n=1 Tax=Candidatus Synechococcus spongiarum SP3 TaxID=1604020 RepID=A0A0G2HJX3_9SYNE|nr:MAG: hypothetical protein TE42_07585 [Candidatus Synechococcus spongiarum SP3]
MPKPYWLPWMVEEWLVQRRPRLHLHCTPTYASWIHQVERFFGIISQKAMRRTKHQDRGCCGGCGC